MKPNLYFYNEQISNQHKRVNSLVLALLLKSVSVIHLLLSYMYVIHGGITKVMVTKQNVAKNKN